MPGTARSSLGLKNMKQVKFDPKHDARQSIERIIQEQTGRTIKLDQSDMRVTKLKSTGDMVQQFAEVLPYMQDERIALNQLKGDVR